jgi:nitrite reductase (NO-forming)
MHGRAAGRHDKKTRQPGKKPGCPGGVAASLAAESSRALTGVKADGPPAGEHGRMNANPVCPALSCRPALILLVAVLAQFWLVPSSGRACPACNLAFADDVFNRRADSQVSRDLRQAIANQSDLALADLGGGQWLVNAVAATAAGQSPAAVPAEPPPAAAAAALPDPAAAAANEAAPLPATPPPVPAGAAAAAGASGRGPLPEWFKDADFSEIHERDNRLPLPPTSTVPQDAPPDKSFTVELHEGPAYIGNGVVYDGFLMNGKIPGPTIIVEEGDVVEMNVVNKGTVPHGASIHAAYTQTSKYLGKIMPGESRKMVFQVNTPGVFMYHCAPGGHAIPMHVLFGQYGMMVVKPKELFQLEKDLGRPPDQELFLLQHELYASGRDAIAGDPAYITFNGKLFRYVEEPIKVKPGDFIRIYFLNVGPNLLSTFHIVGIIWDYVYWQGHPAARWPGGQTVTAGPADSWVIEFRIPPDEGAYTMLSHAVGSTSRGAIGLMVAEKDHETQPVILADGPELGAAELAKAKDQAVRVISPFKPGTHPDDAPVVSGPATKEVRVSIIGNSFWPKVIQIAPGTKVTWTNEDAFTYLAGEFAGVHNVASTSAPPDGDFVVGPMLAHGESWSHVFESEWDYDYICTPHPYMHGRVIVKKPDYTLAAGTTGAAAGPAPLAGWVLPLLGVCFVMSLAAFASRAARPRDREPQ